jgi:CRP/FNR family cyclic AMP-dependent transcriptional regulator
MPAEERIAAWRRLAPSLLVMACRDRETIHAQGDELAGLFCLLSGAVKLSHVTDQGRQLTIAVLGPESLFGSVSSAKTSNCAATAIGEVRLVRLAPAEVARLVGDDPCFAAFLNAGLEAGRERAERKLIDRETKTVEVRIVETLYELALMFGAPCAHGYSLEIPLTQQDIADLVHATRPVVAKIMSALRRRGALDYRRDLICVNHAALRSASAGKSPAL